MFIFVARSVNVIIYSLNLNIRFAETLDDTYPVIYFSFFLIKDYTKTCLSYNATKLKNKLKQTLPCSNLPI